MKIKLMTDTGLNLLPQATEVAGDILRDAAKLTLGDHLGRLAFPLDAPQWGEGSGPRWLHTLEGRINALAYLRVPSDETNVLAYVGVEALHLHNAAEGSRTLLCPLPPLRDMGDRYGLLDTIEQAAAGEVTVCEVRYVGGTCFGNEEVIALTVQTTNAEIVFEAQFEAADLEEAIEAGRACVHAPYNSQVPDLLVDGDAAYLPIKPHQGRDPQGRLAAFRRVDLAMVTAATQAALELAEAGSSQTLTLRRTADGWSAQETVSRSPLAWLPQGFSAVIAHEGQITVAERDGSGVSAKLPLSR